MLTKKTLLIIIMIIWMFHSRTLYNKIIRLHEKALRIVYGDYKSKFVIETLKCWLLKYLNFWMNYPHKLWMNSSRLNRQPHTIWGIKMNYIVEVPKQWRMGLSQSRLWHLKSGQQCFRNWKTLNLYILSKNV